MHVLNDGNIKLQGRVQDDGNESGLHLSITAFQHARARFAKHKLHHIHVRTRMLLVVSVLTLLISNDTPGMAQARHYDWDTNPDQYQY
jgi:hypothetical protein